MRLLYGLALLLSLAGFIGVVAFSLLYVPAMVYVSFGVQMLASLQVGYLEINWRRDKAVWTSTPER